MNRVIENKIDGWVITLQRNVHMYSHALSVEKEQHRFNIDCEDLPTEEKSIGVWLYSSGIPKELYQEVRKVLLQWAQKFEVKFHIYISASEYITNRGGA